jgi:hypothetical protein
MTKNLKEKFLILAFFYWKFAAELYLSHIFEASLLISHKITVAHVCKIIINIAHVIQQTLQLKISFDFVSWTQSFTYNGGNIGQNLK